MNPWELLLDLLGWSLIVIVALVVVSIIWALILATVRSTRDWRRKRKAQQIFKSPAE